MGKLATLAIVVGIALGGIVLIAIGGGLLVLLAYGVGLLVNLVLHFEPFQVTVLSLAGIIGTGFVATRILSNFMSIPSPFDDDYDEDDYDDDDSDDDEYLDKSHHYPGIPRWRQPLKAVDFAGVNPDDRCPCGSGRKYKNCHGSKRGK